MGTLKKVIFSLITSFVLVLGMPLLAQASPLAYPTERIAGQDRVDTAINISQKGWDSAQTVILAEYSDYPDSIAATPFAVSLNAPILLTDGNSLDPRVIKELKRLKPQKVILLGGEGCLKPSIVQELSQLGIASERIGGADRYATSVLLAQKVKSDSLILANGDDFPDALSAASFAGIKQIPIVLTSKSLPDSVIRYYRETQPQHLIVIGGEAVIPSETLSQNNFKVEIRLGGQDRFETNAKVVTYAKDTYGSHDLFLASGLTFPDAVAGTVLASKFKVPLLLTETQDIPPAVYRVLREHMLIEPPSTNPGSGTNGSGPTGGNPPGDKGTKVAREGKISASGGLNLRSTPATTGQVLLTIPANTVIPITGQQDRWYQTTYQGKTGWIFADYVTVTKTQTIQKGKITAASGLNLRAAPSSSGNVLLTIPPDSIVELTDQQKEWYQTTYQGKTGWIFSQYVALISQSSSPGDSASGPASTVDSTNHSTVTGDPSSAIDLSVNGTVHILGGSGVVSLHTEKILEGKESSSYSENLQAFPPLPSTLPKPDPPSRGGTTPPTSDHSSTVPTTYDPSTEIPVDPFKGIPANALAGKTIVVDPGHGAPDTGAVGPNHTYEKDNNLAIGLALKDILKQAGAAVLMTRDNDNSPAADYSEIADLQARVDLANQRKADFFISIHNDSFSNPDAHGTSTYYSADNPKNNESLHLAGSIETALINITGSYNRGVKEAGFYVIKHTTMPAVLIETAFISNPYEEARLQNPTYQKNVAAAIFQGLYMYMQTPLPKD